MADFVLWTPLTGFDLKKADFGTEEYFKKIKFNPKTVSLFLFNPDFINLFEANAPLNKVFPKDYCNYYGSVGNEIRKTQKWRARDLMKLVSIIKQKKIRVYVCIMGMHTHIEKENSTGAFGFTARQEFIKLHPELEQTGALWSGNTYVLKRLSDGTEYRDYFSRKAVEVLDYYGFDGLHLADGFVPPCIQISKGDYSDDFYELFLNNTGISVPEEISPYRNIGDKERIKKRADWTWKNARIQWINFVRKRWNDFFGTLSSALHAHGKKLAVNNAWTSEPFEALYRFGIDYRQIAEAGVDEIYAESQATSVYSSGDETFKLKMHEYNYTPLFIRAFAPHIKNIPLNFAKDSTEENSIISHLPCADEREIYVQSSFLYYDGKKTRRATDGFNVCLADALSEHEWSWLNSRYESAFSKLPRYSLSPVLVWSDAFVDRFLEIYAKTKRWSAHKLCSELSGLGGKLGGAVRTENIPFIENVYPALFVPLVDLLGQKDIDLISSYKGAVITVGTGVNISDRTPDISFSDNYESDEKTRLTCSVYNAKPDGVLPNSEPYDTFIGTDDTEYDEYIWYYNMTFRKVSVDFLRKTAAIIKKLSLFGSDSEGLLTFWQYKNGKIKGMAENDRLLQYKSEIIKVQNVKNIKNLGNFPVQPFKIMMPDGQIVSDDNGKYKDKMIGFRVNIPPLGVSVFEIEKDST